MGLWKAVGVCSSYFDGNDIGGQGVALSSGVVFGSIPDWVKDKHVFESISEKNTIKLNGARYCISTEYHAEALGDVAASHPKQIPIQESVNEKLFSYNSCLWLARPTPLVIDMVFHFMQVGLRWQLRQIQSFPMPGSFYEYNERLKLDDFKLGVQIYESYKDLRAFSPLWSARRTVWTALFQDHWITGFMLKWIAMEALFGDALSSGKITYKLSHRAGKMLGASYEETIELIKNIKKGYSWRSKAIHGLKLDKLYRDETLPGKITKEVEEWVRRALIQIITLKLVDIFNDENKRVQYLDSLLLGREKTQSQQCVDVQLKGRVGNGAR
ncbi:MAG: hypothetical protein ABIF71_11030 [Planctomycetota bacterium]